MKLKINSSISKIYRKALTSLATFALVVTTLASNQRCWYVLHEEKLPDKCKELRRF